MAQQQPNVVYVVQPAQVVTAQQIQPTLPVHLPFGSNPLRMTCPHCQSEIVSKLEYVSSTKTHILAAGLCLLGFCCCAPCVYCVDDAKAKKHTCPKCQAFLGIYDKVFGI